MITIPKKLILYLKSKEDDNREKLSTSIFTLKGNYVYANVEIHNLIDIEYKLTPNKILDWISEYISDSKNINDDATTTVEYDQVGKQVIDNDNEGKYFIK